MLSHYFFKYFILLLSLSFPSRTTIMHLLVFLMMSHISLCLCSFFVIPFSLCFTDCIILVDLPSSSLSPYSGSSDLQLSLFGEFFILDIILSNSRTSILFLSKTLSTSLWIFSIRWDAVNIPSSLSMISFSFQKYI